jgi:hypothetical protein
VVFADEEGVCEKSVAGSNKIFEDSECLDDDESDNTLLCILFVMRDSVFSK